MIHIFPLNDKREHETKGTMCWCKPYVEWNDPETGKAHAEVLVIHHAADHREIIEDAERILEIPKRVNEG